MYWDTQQSVLCRREPPERGCVWSLAARNLHAYLLISCTRSNWSWIVDAVCYGYGT